MKGTKNFKGLSLLLLLVVILIAGCATGEVTVHTDVPIPTDPCPTLSPEAPPTVPPTTPTIPDEPTPDEPTTTSTPNEPTPEPSENPDQESSIPEYQSYEIDWPIFTKWPITGSITYYEAYDGTNILVPSKNQIFKFNSENGTGGYPGIKYNSDIVAISMGSSYENIYCILKNKSLIDMYYDVNNIKDFKVTYTPLDLFVTENEVVVLTTKNGKNYAIEIFDTKTETFSIWSDNSGMYSGPYSIAVGEKKGYTYISFTESNLIVVFDKNYKVIDYLYLIAPKGIYIRNKLLYVACADITQKGITKIGFKVFVINDNHKEVGGYMQTPSSELSNCDTITTDLKGKVYVADKFNNTLTKLSPK